VAIQNRFTALADGTGEWDTFNDAHTKVAEEVLGFRRYVRHEWISDRTRNLVEKKRTARLNHDMDQYKDLNRQCKKLARQDKQNWAESRAIQGEAYLATGQIKDAFAHFRNLRAACPRKVSPILDDHGNLISDKAAKAHRWKNHFEQLLNHLSVPCPDLPSTVQKDQRDCQEPSELEVYTAVRKLKNGKAPGLCGITAEMLKDSGDLGILWLTSVIKQV